MTQRRRTAPSEANQAPVSEALETSSRPQGKATVRVGGFRFCRLASNSEPMLEVRSDATLYDVLNQAWGLIDSIANVAGRAVAEGGVTGTDFVIDMHTAYLIEFAANAAAALVGSVDLES